MKETPEFLFYISPPVKNVRYVDLNVSLIKRGYKFEEASNLSKGLNCGDSLVKQEEND